MHVDVAFIVRSQGLYHRHAPIFPIHDFATVDDRSVRRWIYADAAQMQSIVEINILSKVIADGFRPMDARISPILVLDEVDAILVIEGIGQEC